MRARFVVVLAVVGCFEPPAPTGPKPGMPQVMRPAPPATPPPGPPSAAPAAPAAAPADLGQAVYESGGSTGLACATCHQRDGAGLPPSFPPLKGQAAAMGDCVQHAGIVVHGLSGKLVIDGVEYNGVMPAQGNLGDEEIAAVITYERTHFGNSAGACSVADVVAARAKAPAQPP
jgi:nitrite reductase (NO-forming)